MAIDKEIFVELLGELQTYYKREFTPFVQRIWYRHLSDKLTTDQFSASVEAAIVTHQFMPTPEELIEIVRGSRETIALEDWEKCRLAASRADYSIGEHLSLSGKFALRTIGGISRLAQSEESEHKWMRKEFVAAWLAWTKPMGALPEGQLRDRQQQNVDNSVPPPPHVADAMRSLLQRRWLNKEGDS